MNLLLASASPRRRALLAELGWTFDVCPADVDETPRGGETPEALVGRLARDKALHVGRRFPDRWVVAADTVVAVGGAILGKPADREEGLAMLRLLQGRAHRVLTGVALAVPGEETPRGAVECTEVRFRPLDEASLRAYAESGEGDDKAGSYAIQGKGALLVEGIAGCYFNVVGLPLTRLSALLGEAGWPLASQWVGAKDA